VFYYTQTENKDIQLSMHAIDQTAVRPLLTAFTPAACRPPPTLPVMRGRVRGGGQSVYCTL